MPPRLNLAGRVFGLLTVACDQGKDAHGAVMWRCDCACGESTIVRGSTLLAGRTISCGCLLRDPGPRSHGATGTPLYRRWRAMLQRCFNPKNVGYANYGGRGITVCQRWATSFESFADDVGSGFAEHLELDRYPNNDGNYEPGNVRWATKPEQSINRRNNHRLTHGDVTLTIREWGALRGIKPNTIITRLRRGKSVEQALELANG